MNELMADHGGFEHNRQSLRIVDELEKRYPSFRGLNLTWEVREGIIKHSSEHDHPDTLEEFDIYRRPSLEAQIVDLADEIAYNNHDIDDGLSSQMISLEDLKDVALWQENYEQVKSLHRGADQKVLKYQTIIRIINQQVTDLVENILDTVERENIDSPEKVRERAQPIARFSPQMAAKNLELKRFLRERLYNHYRVLRMADKAERIIRALFETYLKKPELMPPHFVAEIDRVGKERLICDYIAGMTDRFALTEYKKLTDPFERV